MKTDVSRRSFVTGGAVAAGAAAMFALAGCSPKSAGSASESKAADASWAQVLNVDIASTLPGCTSESVKVEETKDCDVLVIGAGCSGTNTAIRAAELGKKVILVEKSSSIGGASNKSSGPVAYNSYMSRDQGVEETDLLPILNAWVTDSHWRVDPASIHQLLAKSGEAIDWMHGMGWEFRTWMGPTMMRLPDYPEREPLWRENLKKYVETNGEVLTETTAKSLVVEGGKVTGAVVVKDKKGIQINAGAVVIATGGYAGNPEMVKTAFRFSGVMAGLPQNVGEGLEMAWKAGAQKPQNFGGQMLHQTLARATDLIKDDFEDFQAKMPMILCYVTTLMNVGSSGVRFRNEEQCANAVPAANSSAYQGSFHYVVVSKTQMDALESSGLTALNVTKSPGLPPAYKPAFELDTPWTDITKVFDKMVEKGAGYKGNTPKELAEAAGMDVTLFENQFKAYESYCANGVDEQLGKAAENLVPYGDGPYYIITSEENCLCSWGGLLTNTDYEVLDYDRLPVPGLYAVGNEAGSCLYNDTYVGNGVGMMNTITSGYVCGTKLGQKK